MERMKGHNKEMKEHERSMTRAQGNMERVKQELQCKLESVEQHLQRLHQEMKENTIVMETLKISESSATREGQRWKVVGEQCKERVKEVEEELTEERKETARLRHGLMRGGRYAGDEEEGEGGEGGEGRKGGEEGTWRMKFQISKGRIIKLTEETTTLTNQFVQSKSDLFVCTSELQETKAQRDAAVHAREQLCQEMEAVTEEVNRLEVEASSLRQHEMRYKLEKSQYQTTVTQWEEKNEQLKKKYEAEIYNKVTQMEQLRTDMDTLSTKMSEIKVKSKNELSEVKKKMHQYETETSLLKRKEIASNEEKNKMTEELQRIQSFNKQRKEQISQSEAKLRMDLDAALAESHRTQEQLRSIKSVVKQAEIKMKIMEHENNVCREEHGAMSIEVEKRETLCIDLKNQLLDSQSKFKKDVVEEKRQHDLHQHTITDLQERIKEMQVRSENVNRERTRALEDSERSMTKEKVRNFSLLWTILFILLTDL